MVLGCAACVAVPVAAQPRRAAEVRPDPQIDARYQLIVMESVLEAAVQHGARVLSRQLQNGMPQMTLMSGNARARGFRLEGYGVFFDVDVPSMRQSIVWSYRQLFPDNDGTAASLDLLKKVLASVTDPVQKREVEQAIRSLELRVGPAPNLTGGVRSSAPGTATAVPAGTTGAAPPSAPAAGAVAANAAPAAGAADNPDAAYTDAVRDALIDAMLSYSQRLGIGPEESLTIAARDAGNPRVTGDDPADVITIFLRVKGSDLKAFHEGRITRDEAHRRVEVREY